MYDGNTANVPLTPFQTVTAIPTTEVEKVIDKKTFSKCDSIHILCIKRTYYSQGKLCLSYKNCTKNIQKVQTTSTQKQTNDWLNLQYKKIQKLFRLFKHCVLCVKSHALVSNF